MSSKEFRNNSTRLHSPRQALQGIFREKGVKQASTMQAQVRKPHQHLQKDPQKILQQHLYEGFLKGLDKDTH